ncbi:hypothetical protein [Legionella lansingensis]|nr:hypothetical protein [Legionella lansingensis]
MKSEEASQHVNESQTPETSIRLECMHNSMVFTKTEFLCCEHEGRRFRYSSNNQLEDSCNPSLAAELAVFSGNVMKLILGEPQPDYYLARHTQKDKYYRISNELEDYEDWNCVIRINPEGEIFFNWKDSGDKPILSVKIHQLTAILVVCHFLGEIDWADDNFGFVKRGDEFIAVRLDPACSFHSSVFNNTYGDLAKKLENLLISYISKEINEHTDEPFYYLSGLIDHESKTLKTPTAKRLFSNRAELIETLCRISELSKEELDTVAKKSFSKENWSIAEDYVKKLLFRQEAYQEAFYTLSKQKKQKHDATTSAEIVPLKYFEPPKDDSFTSISSHPMGTFSLSRKRKQPDLPAGCPEEQTNSLSQSAT